MKEQLADLQRLYADLETAQKEIVQETNNLNNKSSLLEYLYSTRLSNEASFKENQISEVLARPLGPAQDVTEEALGQESLEAELGIDDSLPFKLVTQSDLKRMVTTELGDEEANKELEELELELEKLELELGELVADEPTDRELEKEIAIAKDMIEITEEVNSTMRGNLAILEEPVKEVEQKCKEYKSMFEPLTGPKGIFNKTFFLLSLPPQDQGKIRDHIIDLYRENDRLSNILDQLNTSMGGKSEEAYDLSENMSEIMQGKIAHTIDQLNLKQEGLLDIMSATDTVDDDETYDVLKDLGIVDVLGGIDLEDPNDIFRE
ncbi:hypothetical protein [Candidatus Synchoanobacter obligatus]|uniref:Uncharacterized protein n=1 Tax=Candidatus Synchoanobacter obligatus TaxID=2919597 RepID=A0ABT1L3A3_9GAMM|nr:hypothetical protein [Candidatus Synchoanobacter obligatus]MCP8351717.1 hypothetical protein [Candidatus Synchoanobacter obligatus]